MGNVRILETESRKKLIKLANANPEWFDMANKVLRQYHQGEQQLLGAIMLGVMEAHKMGAEGVKPTKEVPPPSEDAEDQEIVIDNKPANRRIRRRA